MTVSFFDGGNKSLSFGHVGDETMRGVWQGGQVANISAPVDSMSFTDPSQPKTFKNGETVKKIVFTLDTRAGKCPAPPLDEEDDGVRDWHVDKGSGQARGVAAALRAGKLGDVEVGGFIYIRWTTGKGVVGDARNFECIVEPAVPGAGTGQFMDAPEPSFPGQVVPAQQPSFPPQVAPGQAAAPRFDPNTGQPLSPPEPPAQQQPAPRFDPMTGQPLAPVQAQQPPAPRFDPNTGQPIGQAPAAQPVTNPYAQR